MTMIDYDDSPSHATGSLRLDSEHSSSGVSFVCVLVGSVNEHQRCTGDVGTSFCRMGVCCLSVQSGELSATRKEDDGIHDLRSFVFDLLAGYPSDTRTQSSLHVSQGTVTCTIVESGIYVDIEHGFRYLGHARAACEYNIKLQHRVSHLALLVCSVVELAGVLTSSLPSSPITPLITSSPRS